MSLFGQSADPSSKHSCNPDPLRNSAKSSVPAARSKAGRTRIRPAQQLMDTAEVRAITTASVKARKIDSKIVVSNPPSSGLDTAHSYQPDSPISNPWKDLNINVRENPSTRSEKSFASPEDYQKNQAFCRRARKLRASHAKNPARMHRALSELSSEDLDSAEYSTGYSAGKSNPDARPNQSPNRVDSQASASAVAGMRSPKVHTIDAHQSSGAKHGFAQKVVDILKVRRNGILRYSERVTLLREAGQLGIGRFEANLIIASVQHQVQLAKARNPSTQPRMFSSFIAGVAMQGLIAWGIYRAMK